jgi:hypothetical protein
MHVDEAVKVECRSVYCSGGVEWSGVEHVRAVQWECSAVQGCSGVQCSAVQWCGMEGVREVESECSAGVQLS